MEETPRDPGTEATRLAGSIYRQIQRWDYFSRKTLGDQMFRAAVSVASNMAEGRGRTTRQEYQFTSIAFGSCNETIAQLRISQSCALMPRSTAAKLVARYEGVQSYLRDCLTRLEGCDDNSSRTPEPDATGVPF